MNLQNICDSVDTLKRLALINNCFSVKMQQVVMAELCCLSRLAYPVDGFVRVSDPILPNETLLLFDNANDISPIPNKAQVRGMILCLHYPREDADGAVLPDAEKLVGLRIFNSTGVEFVLPIYNTFILLGNPITKDQTTILSRAVVENTGNFTISAEGLLLTVGKDGVQLNGLQNPTSNCCL